MMIENLVLDRLRGLFYRSLSSDVLEDFDRQTRQFTFDLLRDAAEMAAEDLAAYLERDPALLGEASFAIVPNSPFIATMCYRLAHLLWTRDGRIEHRNAAFAISHYARARSGAEIHPGAQIGRRFVLDHGTNTVIGATCQIGKDCYVLNGVVLGARGIASNCSNKRHPTIGNRVQIGSFARILGDVTVGDDCFIGPHSCVTSDLPKGSKTRDLAPYGGTQSQPLAAQQRTS